jgi:hypothetical protein
VSVRVEFKLGMPGTNSWNGRWSGEERNYAIIKTMSISAADVLLGDKGERYFSYSFGDGWVASVTARVVPAGKRRAKSDGFSGYEWMVDSIIACGRILNDAQREALNGRAEAVQS